MRLFLMLGLLGGDIAWIGINIIGTNAIVEIRETVESPPVIDPNQPANVVSDVSGIITAINVQNGTAAVAVRRYCKGR